MCPHTPPCPDASAPDREAARTVVCHPEQGWSLLCNGIVVFEDRGGDGHFSSRQVFADDFQRLTSVEIGHGGVGHLSGDDLSLSEFATSP